MKVLATKVINDDTEIWFRVELERNTQILAQELFTKDDVAEARRMAVRDFLDGLFASWSENN